MEKINKKTHAKWLSKHKHGDNTKIAAKLSMSSAAISLAINKGEGSLKVINAINNFYK